MFLKFLLLGLSALVLFSQVGENWSTVSSLSVCSFVSSIFLLFYFILFTFPLFHSIHNKLIISSSCLFTYLCLSVFVPQFRKSVATYPYFVTISFCSQIIASSIASPVGLPLDENYFTLPRDKTGLFSFSLTA